MRKILLFAAALICLASCSQKWNDLVHEEVPAEITAFSVEGQVSSSIGKTLRTVTVTVPEGTDLTSLTISEYKYTESAKADRTFAAGEVIDLSAPVQVTLTTYDPYVWTISAVFSEPEPFKEGPQLYNMSFDFWSKHPDNKNVDMSYAEDATDEQKAVWGSANLTTAIFQLPTVMQESAFVAVEGPGKSALKLQTQNVMNKLAAGSLFNGRMGDINIWKMSADLYWGIPFTERPRALEGYACYQPKAIDIVQEPYTDKMGKLDNGHVFVLLTDWEEPFKVSPPESLVDFENDPAIIGYGKVVFDKEMDKYEKFTLNIEYRSDRTPKYVAIVTSSSALGDYFTGGTGSVLYLDEFKFLY